MWRKRNMPLFYRPFFFFGFYFLNLHLSTHLSLYNFNIGRYPFGIFTVTAKPNFTHLSTQSLVTLTFVTHTLFTLALEPVVYVTSPRPHLSRQQALAQLTTTFSPFIHPFNPAHNQEIHAQLYNRAAHIAAHIFFLRCTRFCHRPASQEPNPSVACECDWHRLFGTGHKFPVMVGTRTPIIISLGCLVTAGRERLTNNKRWGHYFRSRQPRFAVCIGMIHTQ
ncbi:hypothetical protein B0J18DRAFT_86621 [Chaetomium sp. MPI-SDFR-AT-0129]|nr:hypothetical protein B0J18DRAFT_86621 [Chaetomium sp. MPI-SDFR-AT-0129]